MNRDSIVGISKANRITRTLEHEIRTGTVSHGDRLESENILMQRFCVSRNTIRKSLNSLAQLGLITTRSGIGSFVTYDDKKINNDLGWTLALSRGKAQIETRLLSLKRGGCAKTRDTLSVTNDFLRIDRLRIDVKTDRGVALERSRLPWRECFTDIVSSGLQNDSLSRTLNQLGVVVAHGEERAGVLASLPKEIASTMQRRAGEPMLRLRRLTRAADESIVEYVESILDPDRFGLHLEF